MMRKRKIAPTFHSALRSNMMQFGTVPTLAPTIPLGGRFRTCRLLQFASLMSYLFRSLEFVDSSVLVKRVSCIYLILCFFISRRGRLRWGSRTPRRLVAFVQWHQLRSLCSQGFKSDSKPLNQETKLVAWAHLTHVEG